MVGRGLFFDSGEGVVLVRLRISRMSRMVDRDEGDAAEKRRWDFFSSLSREL